MQTEPNPFGGQWIGLKLILYLFTSSNSDPPCSGPKIEECINGAFNYLKRQSDMQIYVCLHLSSSYSEQCEKDLKEQSQKASSLRFWHRFETPEIISIPLPGAFKILLICIYLL